MPSEAIESRIPFTMFLQCVLGTTKDLAGGFGAKDAAGRASHHITKIGRSCPAALSAWHFGCQQFCSHGGVPGIPMPAPREEIVLPADALVIKQVLESMGIKEYEPRVVHQLLDFMYRNVAEVLQVAEAFSDRGGSAKKEVGMEDIMLAIQAKATTSFVAPPSQDALQAMADRRNKNALPALATKYGFRLPPPEDCLIAPSFQFHPQNPTAEMDWEETDISSGVGTEPTAAPPSRQVKAFRDVQGIHPAFQEEGSTGPSTVIDTGQTGDSVTAVDMQS